jgi:hypothetical protein
MNIKIEGEDAYDIPDSLSSAGSVAGSLDLRFQIGNVALTEIQHTRASRGTTTFLFPRYRYC